MNWMLRLKTLGPGLLFAGAAVGVSHLVYSTKAGALYGFGLLWLVLLANFFKYPFFEFGPRYTAATGESLLKGYQRIGTWVLALFIAVTLLTMFTIQAAVTIVTASLATYLFGAISTNVMLWVLLLLLLCALMLIIGRYQLLDNLMKFIIVSLTILTFVTVLMALNNHASPLIWQPCFPTDAIGLTFVIAFMGWMPAPLDLSVWHSLWVIEKQKKEATSSDVSKATEASVERLAKTLFDFRVGYWGTTFLAIFFLALGALVMFESGEQFSAKGAVFAQQLIELYTQTLGPQSGLFVGLAAFITMFSTTITCLDALPRAMAKAHFLIHHKTRIDSDPAEKLVDVPKMYYFGWMMVLIVGSLIILNVFMVNMSSFLKIATILSFLTTPFFAIVNYILVTRFVPVAFQPSKKLRLLSALGLVYLLVFCCIYLTHLYYA